MQRVTIALFAACLVQAAGFSVTCQDRSGSVSNTGFPASCALNETDASIVATETFSPGVFSVLFQAYAEARGYYMALQPEKAMASTDALLPLPAIAPGDVLKVDLGAWTIGNGAPSFQVELQGGPVSIPLLLSNMFPSQCFEYLGCQKHVSIAAAVSRYSLHVVSDLLVFDPSGFRGVGNNFNITFSVFQPDGVTPSEFIPEPAPAFLVAAGLLLGIRRLKSTAAGSAP